MKRRLLILRPEPGASSTASRAAALGLDAIKLPLFEAHAVDWKAPDPARFDAVLMTSANAARLGGPNLDRYLHLPLYAVGAPTANVAKKAGFSDVVTGTSDVTAIADKIVQDGHINVIHLAGQDRTRIQETSLNVTAVTIYASCVLPASIIPTDTVALLHSARAAHRFCELANDKSSIAIVAISHAVADAAGPGWQSVTIADRPQDAAMLALAVRLCETREE